MKYIRPPRLPSRLLGLVLKDPDASAFHGDLDERFRKIVVREGLWSGRRWYWRQCLSVATWALLFDRNRVASANWGGLFTDVRTGLRTIRRRPMYALGISGTFALGLAAAMTTFAVAWGVWIAPMPYPDPDRVVRLYEIEPVPQGARRSPDDVESRRQLLSPTLLGDLREQSLATIQVVSSVTRSEVSWETDGGTQRLATAILHLEGFHIFGIVPLLGRLPSEPETEGGAEIVLAERFWNTAFGADPKVIGQALDLGWGHVPVVGVVKLPSGYPGNVDVLMMDGWGRMIHTEDRGFRNVEAVARLRPGASVSEARAELSAFVRTLAETHPEHRGWGMSVSVLADDLFRPFRDVLALLLASGATFLLLAVVNVTGLVGARRVHARRDRSIRLALGASEGRLLRGSLTEGALLALIGAVGGTVLACWLVGWIRSGVSQEVPRITDLAVGPTLVLVGLLIGIATGMAVGTAGYVMARGAGPAIGRAPVWRAVELGGSRVLVIGQVALTTLLTAAGVSIAHHVTALRSLDLGYEPAGVSYTSTVLIEHADLVAPWTLARSILQRLEARGISGAMAFNTPMADRSDIPQVSMTSEGGEAEVVYDLHLISPGYFDVMGIELLAGRDFGSGDHEGSERVVIVSEEFAEQYFPDGTTMQEVVGRVIAPLIYETDGPRVVGIVRSTRHRGPDLPVEPEIYSPMSQLALDLMTLVVRGDSESIAEAVSTVTRQVDSRQEWSPLVPFASRLRDWFAPLRMQTATVGAMAGLGTLLASLGVYVLLAYQVARRRKELGIRKALGASDARIVLSVVGGGFTLAVLGALVGLAMWYGLLPSLGSLLGEVQSRGRIVPVSAVLVVGATGILAALLPAVRAVRVDVVATLNAD